MKKRPGKPIKTLARWSSFSFWLLKFSQKFRFRKILSGYPGFVAWGWGRSGKEGRGIPRVLTYRPIGSCLGAIGICITLVAHGPIADMIKLIILMILYCRYLGRYILGFIN